ncbi:MAG: bestrophin family ion channel [Planctomycetota bacterium]
MLTKSRYSVLDMLRWTRIHLRNFALYALVVVALFDLLDLRFLRIPWAPVAVLGTAVAFIVGFQNNAAYGRIWEARKIWGGILNRSRTLGIQIQDMVTNEYAKEPVSEEALKRERKILLHRHLAWVTSMRHAMRQPRPWEEFHNEQTNREWSDAVCIPERVVGHDDDLNDYLSPEEAASVLRRRNAPSAILELQSKHLRRLKEQGLVWEFSFLELQAQLKDLLDLQGASERIKNFPYPRQYATLSHQFVWLFILCLPFATLPEFAKLGDQLSETYPKIAPAFVWLAVPFCTLIAWIFHTMLRIGRVGENPFEGSANDVPISTMSRTIEIEVLQMLGADPGEIPDPIPELKSVQM